MTKTLTFSAMHFTVAFTVAYVLTGSLVIGGVIALIEPSINTIAYYFHEKAWDRWQDKRTARQGMHEYEPVNAREIAANFALSKG